MATAMADDLSESSLMKALWSPEIQIEDIKKITHTPIAEYVNEQGQVRGYPPLYMMGNVFTMTAHLLGKSVLEVIPHSWKEKIISFTVIIGPRGTNKSGASADAVNMILEFSRLAEADEKRVMRDRIQREVERMAEVQNNTADGEEPPEKKQKLDKLKSQMKKIKSSDFQKYHSNLTPTMLDNVLANGDGNIVMIQDEMASFFKALNNGGIGSKDPKSYFCSLFGGSRVKSGSKKSGEVDVDDPRVQLCGYIQPDLFTELCAVGGDGQGVQDRLTLLCPVPRLMDFDEMCEQQSTLDIHLEYILFGIAYSHMTPRTYSMTEGAKKLFAALTKKHKAMLMENNCAGSLRGLLKKMETKTLRSSVVNAALRNAMVRQEAEEKLPQDDRWYSLKLSTATKDEKIKKASEGRLYVVDEEDMEKAINLQTYSMELYKICSSFANDLQKPSSSKSKPKSLQKTPIGGRNLGDPTEMDVNYAVEHVEKIQGIFTLKEKADGKIKGTTIATAKFFPQLRIQGANTRDLCIFFLQALHHMGIIIYDKESHLVEKVLESDDENVRKVFEALLEAMKGEFNPLGLEVEDPLF